MTIEESVKQQIRYVIKRNIRALRIKNDETIIDMANKLDMSIVELSAIENSKIDIPKGFLKKIYKIYKLTEKEQKSFCYEVTELPEKINYGGMVYLNDKSDKEKIKWEY